MAAIEQYPIFIITRDRVTCLAHLLHWLGRAGQERIYILDNESTFPPMVNYLKGLPFQVINTGGNCGHTVGWNQGYIEKYAAGEYFVVTDPDVIPTESCPLDALDHFRGVLDRNPDRTKCGFGLKIDDLPNHYRHKQSVIKYESQFQSYGGTEPGIHFAPIDTTFALYRPGAPADISFSVRTSEPYMARHMAWYVDSENLDEEELYYRAHANQAITSWNKDELPHWAPR